VDGRSRFDNMQQHTGQHLLVGGLFADQGGMEDALVVVSFWGRICTIDLRGPEPPEETLHGRGESGERDDF